MILLIHNMLTTLIKRSITTYYNVEKDVNILLVTIGN